MNKILNQRHASFCAALLITIVFCTHTLFSSENRGKHLSPCSQEYQSCLEQNNHLGDCDRYLFHKHLRFTYSQYEGKCPAGRYFYDMYDEIFKRCYIVCNEEKRGFSPFQINFSDPDSLKEIEDHLNKTGFISNNEQNRQYAERVPGFIPLDHCTYALKLNGKLEGVICYFFDRQVLLRMLIDFIKNLP